MLLISARQRKFQNRRGDERRHNHPNDDRRKHRVVDHVQAFADAGEDEAGFAARDHADADGEAVIAFFQNPEAANWFADNGCETDFVREIRQRR